MTNFGIWTERPRPVNFSVRGMRRKYRLRRFPVFSPLLECAQHVERVRGITSAAVVHTGCHIKTIGVSRLLAARGGDALVVVNTIARHHLLVRPSVILNQLAAVREERPQIRVSGAEHT